MLYNYEEVSVKATKKWVENGKKHQKTKKFFKLSTLLIKTVTDTLNPRNKFIEKYRKSAMSG